MEDARAIARRLTRFLLAAADFFGVNRNNMSDVDYRNAVARFLEMNYEQDAPFWSHMISCAAPSVDDVDAIWNALRILRRRVFPCVINGWGFTSITDAKVQLFFEVFDDITERRPFYDGDDFDDNLFYGFVVRVAMFAVTMDRKEALAHMAVAHRVCRNQTNRGLAAAVAATARLKREHKNARAAYERSLRASNVMGTTRRTRAMCHARLADHPSWVDAYDYERLTSPEIGLKNALKKVGEEISKRTAK